MSKVYDTLKKKNDPTVEVYPNVERQNIPDGAINSAKIEDRAVILSKLSDSLQSDVNNFEAIYNAEDDKITVADVEATDDIRCSNVYASSSVYATDSVEGDNATFNTYTDGDGDELKVIVNHCIRAQLVNRSDPSDTRYIHMHFTSSTKTAITTFSELLNELSHKLYMTILDDAHNTLGWISGIDLNSGYVSMFVDDLNGDVEEVDFNSAISINDDTYPI